MSSCGLRQDSESFLNPLIGTWNLAEIECYDAEGNRDEEYKVSSSEQVQMIFQSRTFRYAVSDGTCITSAEASYRLGFKAEKKGTTTYSKFTLSSEGCTISINDSSSGQPYDVPFGMTALDEDSQDLNWEINDAGYLVLQVSTGFKGSDSGACAAECTCSGLYLSETN